MKERISVLGERKRAIPNLTQRREIDYKEKKRERDSGTCGTIRSNIHVIEVLEGREKKRAVLKK